MNSSGSSPGSSSSSSLGRKKWIVNGNNKVAPKDQFPGNFTKFLLINYVTHFFREIKCCWFFFLGIYKAKEFDTHTDFDDDEEETDENENHPDFKPVPFFSLVRKNKWGVFLDLFCSTFNFFPFFLNNTFSFDFQVLKTSCS